MREIKFRAYNIARDSMSYQDEEGWLDHSFFGDNNVHQSTTNIYMLNNNDSCVLMQFTGLISANGTDLFEGDVITFGNSDTLHKIVFSEKGYWFAKCIESNDYYYIGRAMHCDDVYGIKIIGNIHENPELLK